MAAKHRLEQAERRAKQLAVLTDAQLAEAYITALKAPTNINFSPYLVTAIRDAGLWDRLDRAVAERKRHDQV